MAAARRLAPADFITFDFFSKNTRYEDTAWNSDASVVTPELLGVFGKYLHQHPIVRMALENPNGQALKITDATSQSEFEKTDLYNEFYRKVDVNRQMGLALLSEGGLTMTCAFARNRKDYNEREKTILSLAAPHFMNALRNGFAFGRLNAALDAGGSGVIAVDASGRTTFISQFARLLFARYFSSEKIQPDRLPESLSHWLTKAMGRTRPKEYKLPQNPSRIENRNGELTVRLLDNSQTREAILLLEEKKRVSPESFEHLPITKREAEILFWITQGKTDGVIAELCDISIRTVHKHVENIYTKLGVETRTAAMLRGLELL